MPAAAEVRSAWSSSGSGRAVVVLLPYPAPGTGPSRTPQPGRPRPRRRGEQRTRREGNTAQVPAAAHTVSNLRRSRSLNVRSGAGCPKGACRRSRSRWRRGPPPASPGGTTRARSAASFVVSTRFAPEVSASTGSPPRTPATSRSARRRSRSPGRRRGPSSSPPGTVHVGLDAQGRGGGGEPVRALAHGASSAASSSATDSTEPPRRPGALRPDAPRTIARSRRPIGR